VAKIKVKEANLATESYKVKYRYKDISTGFWKQDEMMYHCARKDAHRDAEIWVKDKMRPTIIEIISVVYQ